MSDGGELGRMLMHLDAFVDTIHDVTHMKFTVIAESGHEVTIEIKRPTTQAPGDPKEKR
jgi:hypothetical protein